MEKKPIKLVKSPQTEKKPTLINRILDSIVLKLELIKNDLGNKAFYKIDRTQTQPSTEEIYIKQENRAAELGVKAKYADNHYFAKSMNEALSEFKEAGYPLPKEILNYDLDLNSFSKEFSITEKSAFISTIYPSKNTVSFNTGIIWGKMPEFMNKAYSSGVTSTDNPKHFIYKTLAGIAHNIKDHNRFMANNKWEFDRHELVLIRKNVSLLATDGINNFISEVFTGMLDGRNYKEEIMKLYDEFGGIKVIQRLKV